MSDLHGWTLLWCGGFLTRCWSQGNSFFQRCGRFSDRCQPIGLGSRTGCPLGTGHLVIRGSNFLKCNILEFRVIRLPLQCWTFSTVRAHKSSDGKCRSHYLGCTRSRTTQKNSKLILSWVELHVQAMSTSLVCKTCR